MSARVAAIDLGRGVSVVAMVLVHTLWMYGTKETQHATWFGRAVHFVGHGAPMFLFAMGFSYGCARSRGALHAARRGAKILALGYGMNALKFLVPIDVLGTMPDAFLAAYGWEVPIGARERLELLRTGDILQCAGLSIAALGLVRTRARTAGPVLALALAVAAASGPLRGLTTGVAAADVAVDLLWGATYSVYFPLFPWLSVVLVGLAFGLHHVETGRDEARTFRAIGAFGAASLAVGAAVAATDPVFHVADVFHAGPGGALLLTGSACLLYVLARRCEGLFLRGRLGDAIRYTSARVTALYVLQWVLICWGMGLIGFQTLSAWGVAAAFPVVLLATYGVEHALAALRLRVSAPRPPRARSAPDRPDGSRAAPRRTRACPGGRRGGLRTRGSRGSRAGASRRRP